MRKGVRRVGFEPGRLDVIHLGDLLRRYLARDCSCAGAHDRRFERPSCVSGDRLPGGNRLPRDAVQFSFALFNDYKNCVHKIGFQSSVSPPAFSPPPPEALPETLYSSISAVRATSRSFANSLRLPIAPRPSSPCALVSSWPA